MSIDTDDIVSASAGKIKVNEGNSRNSRVYAFKKSLPVIYNGVSTRKTFSNEMIDNKYGKVRLLDNSGDGGYDVILIDVYENFIASDIIKKDNKVYDKYDNTHSITPVSYTHLDVYKRQDYAIVNSGLPIIYFVIPTALIRYSR